MGRSKPEGEPEPDHASAFMVSLIVEALRNDAPELIPTPLLRLDSVRSAHAPMKQKRDLLRTVFEKLGPRFVFEIGRSFERLPFNPLLQTLLESKNGDVLLGKWMRFERYGHALHRTRVDESGPGDYRLEHYAKRGPAPGPEHDLFIFGVLVALIESTGAQELEAILQPGERWVARHGERARHDHASWMGSTNRWRLRWNAELDTGTRRINSLPPPGGAPNVADRVRHVLSLDTAHASTLPETARALGMSPRSLQRNLKAASTSFTELVRSVRVATACRLLEQDSHSLTEVGYLCGFSDAAHFSRDFRASTGASPSQYRVAALGGV